MNVYRDGQGNSVELPKLTMALSARMDEVGAASTNNARFARQYEFVKDVCGEEYCAEVLDGETIDDIDLVALNVLYIGVVNAYAAPAAKAQAQGVAEQMKALKPIVGVADAVGKFAPQPSRQGFKAVH